MAKAKKRLTARGRPRVGERGLSVTGGIEQRHPDRFEHYIDRLLDEALEQTFPASDAIAVVLTRSR